MTGSPWPGSAPIVPSPPASTGWCSPAGSRSPAGTQVIGRGSRLHFLAGTNWYQLDMDDIPS